MMTEREPTGLPPVFVVGYPRDFGGADTECWHTIKLWRRYGLNVTCIPTSRPASKWYSRLRTIGCATVRTDADHPTNVHELRGAIAMSFCNERFLGWADRFRQLGCKIVWVNCMTWLSSKERQQCGPFDAYVFQSEYQRDKLLPQLTQSGTTPARCYLIRGAIDWEEFPFHPLTHEPGTLFVIGRISRPAPDKYAADTWSIYGRFGGPVRARVVGWCSKVEEKLGRTQAWAECLPDDAESSLEFFCKLHCMVQVNGGAEENWPRSGLEATASGVPVIAQNRWGWREMIRHGETGFLCDTAEEIAGAASQLAADQRLRLRIAHEARRHLELDLDAPRRIGDQWMSLFRELSQAADERVARRRTHHGDEAASTTMTLGQCSSIMTER